MDNKFFLMEYKSCAQMVSRDPMPCIHRQSMNSRAGAVDILLPSDYVLRDDDVLCGRGRKCFTHSGSKKLRDLVQAKLQDYITAPTKIEKTIIIRDVIKQIRETSTNSGFVKYDPLSGRYYDVGRTMAVGPKRIHL
jgi:hypothetical protein